MFKKIKNKISTRREKRKTKKIMKKQIKQEQKDLKYYIRVLEDDKARLESDIKTIQRQNRRELYSYIEPIRQIFTNVNFNKKNQDLSYIETQLKGLLETKNLELFIPEIDTQHDKNTMIVDDVIKIKDKSKDGLIKNVIVYGIKQNDNVIIPARVRIYKGE